jgi:nitroimidazol reductase NimA-like FMN-containing flavoprotein (pyridoxamine 5'-phosphate oxidase superfamily)
MKSALKQEILSVLQNGADMTIATVREDGYPQATTVSYVSDGLTIYFATAASSQKATNLARNPKASLTINLPYASWDDIRGVSIGGTTERIGDAAETTRVVRLMFEKFPQIANYASAVTGELALFRVTPQVVSLLDYRKGFGHTELATAAELEFSGTSTIAA